MLLSTSDPVSTITGTVRINSPSSVISVADSLMRCPSRAGGARWKHVRLSQKV